MLPTSPRSSVRSTCSSCTAPFSTIATRVSCGDQFTRMSCCIFLWAAPRPQDNAGAATLGRPSRPPAVPSPTLKFLEGGGAMGERIRGFDWSGHALGHPDGWPEALRLALSLCLNSSFPTAIYWGPEMVVLYNDAWSVIPAEKHPWILGEPAAQGWADIWDIVGPQFQRVHDEGESFALYDQMLPMVRSGAPRETWWNYSLTPIRHADHSIGGIFNQGHEVTELVVARRERDAELARWREM